MGLTKSHSSPPPPSITRGLPTACHQPAWQKIKIQNSSTVSINCALLLSIHTLKSRNCKLNHRRSGTVHTGFGVRTISGLKSSSSLGRGDKLRAQWLHDACVCIFNLTHFLYTCHIYHTQLEETGSPQVPWLGHSSSHRVGSWHRPRTPS